MFQLNILQNQWLFLALAGGLTIVLWLTLYCLALWRERPDASAPPAEQTGQRPRRWFPPALLIFTYVFILVWAVIYTLMMVKHPPNW